MTTRNFLAVLWSGFHTSTVGVMDWIPDLETKILQAAPEDNPLQTTEASQFITPDKINENSLISNIRYLNYVDCFINSFFQYAQDLNKVYLVWLVDLCLKSLSVYRLYLFLPSPFSFLLFFFQCICWRNWSFYPVRFFTVCILQIVPPSLFNIFPNFLCFLEMIVEAWSDSDLIFFRRNASEMLLCMPIGRQIMSCSLSFNVSFFWWPLTGAIRGC